MAGHVSQFLTRLFGIANEVDALAAATADQNPIFRFKVDFVRRRVIPALKKNSAPADPAVLEAHVRKLRAEAETNAGRKLDPEMATAIAAVDLMQAERTSADVANSLNLLMQWCAAHLHDPAYRNWVSFRFPESIDHFNLVRVQRPEADLPEAESPHVDWRDVVAA